MCNGEVAEWLNAAVLKTAMGHTIGGSNPSLSAILTLLDPKSTGDVHYQHGSF